jgi:hypothetical protein
MRPRTVWTIAAVAVAALGAVAIAVLRLWNALGASEITPLGWLAMGFGVVVASALGIGLMALMFISSRRGFDDVEGGGHDAPPGGARRGGDSSDGHGTPHRSGL